MIKLISKTTKIIIKYGYNRFYYQIAKAKKFSYR